MQSEPDTGTVIRVHFPAAAVACPKPRPAVAENWTGGGAVLVIDDEEAVRVLAARALSRLGFEVLTAADGVEGQELFRSRAGNFDCVFLDLTMPRQGGQETMAALRRERPGARIVLMSGYSEAEVMPALAAERPDGFLQKPFGLSALRDMVGGVAARAA